MFLESPGINSPNRSKLDGIQTKIVRAYEHCSTLDNAIKSFIDSENHVVTHQFDPETFEHIWRLESDPPPIHSIIYALIGNALHNFRDALDHIVWQLVLANGKTPSRSNASPIYIDEVQYKNRGQRKLQGVYADAKAIISKAQPCHGGHQILWALEELSNIDKHRRPPLAFMNVARFKVENLAIPPKQSVAILINQAPLERGAKIVSVVHEDMNVNFEPIFTVAFGDVVPVERNAIMDVFRSINTAVLAVAAEFEPFILK